MKIVRNNIIPFKGYKAINLFGVLFARKNAKITDTTIRHEEIHTAQMKGLLYVPFYIIYVLEFLFRVVQRMFMKQEGMIKKPSAYDMISFEKEAYANQNNKDYKFPLYGWVKYL